MNTKAEIVQAAIQLLSERVPTSLSSSSGTRPVDAGVASFDFNARSELNKYPYSFTFKPYKLSQKAVFDADAWPQNTNTVYSYYTPPADMGRPLAVVTAEVLESSFQPLIIGKRNVRSVPYTYIFSQNTIQVASEDDNLWLVYSSTEIEVPKMNEPFKNALRYFIAADLIDAYKDTKSARTRTQYLQMAALEIASAKRVDVLLANEFQTVPSIDDVIHYGRPDGRVAGYADS